MDEQGSEGHDEHIKDVDDINGCAEYFLNNIIYSDHWEKHIGYAGLSYGTRVRLWEGGGLL